MSLKKLLTRIKNNQVGAGRYPDINSIQYNIDGYLQESSNFRDFFKNIGTNTNFDDLSSKELSAIQVELFRWLFAKPKKPRGIIRPSRAGYNERICDREIYFHYVGLEEDETYLAKNKVDNKLNRIFDIGTLIHAYIQVNLYLQGILTDFEIPVISKELGVDGSADGEIIFNGTDYLGNSYEDERMLLEIKSINDYGFRGTTQPRGYHIRQATIYAKILGLNKICFLYYNKNNSDIRYIVWPVDENFFRMFKQSATGAIELYDENMVDIKPIENHKLPDKVCSNRLCERAMDCPFADTCFSIH
jgi:hypothetical protein